MIYSHTFIKIPSSFLFFIILNHLNKIFHLFIAEKSHKRKNTTFICIKSISPKLKQECKSTMFLNEWQKKKYNNFLWATSNKSLHFLMFRQEYIKTNTYVGCLKVTLKMDSFVLFILEFFFSQNVHHAGKTVFGHFLYQHRSLVFSYLKFFEQIFQNHDFSHFFPLLFSIGSNFQS